MHALYMQAGCELVSMSEICIYIKSNSLSVPCIRPQIADIDMVHGCVNLAAGRS